MTAEGAIALTAGVLAGSIALVGFHLRGPDPCCRTSGSQTEFMAVSVDLPEDALARLRAEATRRGVSIDLVIAELATTLPAEHPAVARKLSFIGLGSSSSGRLARDAGEMLAEGFGRD